MRFSFDDIRPSNASDALNKMPFEIYEMISSTYFHSNLTFVLDIFSRLVPLANGFVQIFDSSLVPG